MGEHGGNPSLAQGNYANPTHALGDTPNFLAMACMDVPLKMCHYALLEKPLLGCRLFLMLPQVTEALEKYKTCQESARKDEGKETVCGHHKQNQSQTGVVSKLLLRSICCLSYWHKSR